MTYKLEDVTVIGSDLAITGVQEYPDGDVITYPIKIAECDSEGTARQFKDALNNHETLLALVEELVDVLGYMLHGNPDNGEGVQLTWQDADNAHNKANETLNKIKGE